MTTEWKEWYAVVKVWMRVEATGRRNRNDRPQHWVAIPCVRASDEPSKRGSNKGSFRCFPRTNEHWNPDVLWCLPERLLESQPDAEAMARRLNVLDGLTA